MIMKRTRPTSKDMDARRERILRGNITRTLFWLASPVMTSQLVNISYNLVDSVFLGRLGKEEFGAPTLTWPLVFLFFSIVMGFSQAGISIVSQLYGANRQQEAERAARVLLTFVIVLSIVLTIIPFALAPMFLTFIRVPSEIFPHALTYIRMILIGFPFVAVYHTFVTISSAFGDTRTPMKLSLISATLNMLLDPLLIFGLLGFPRLEVMGAALATTISYIIVSLLSMYLLFTGLIGIKAVPSVSVFGETGLLYKIVKIGSYLAVQRSANSLGFVMMASIVAHFGSIAVAAYGVALRVIDVLQVINISLSRATQIMIGQNIGAGQENRAREILSRSMVLIAAIMGMGGVILFFVAPHVVKFFVDDPYVINEGAKLIRIMVPSIPFFGLFFMANAASTGSGRVKIFTIIGLLRLWVFRIGLAILLSRFMGMGIEGVWVSISFSNIIAGIIAVLWALTSDWYRGIIGVDMVLRDKESGQKYPLETTSK